MNKINIITNRALKCISKNKISTYNLYIYFKTLNFDDIVKLNTMKFMYRARHNDLAFKLQILFKINSYRPNLFYRNKIRTDRMANCLSSIGPKLWNCSSEHINLNINKHAFNTYYKRFLIDTYSQ